MTWKRSPLNPIFDRRSIPDVPPELVDATSVFNPGAVLHAGRTVLLLRVQSRGRRTFLMRASSDDGLHFRTEAELLPVDGLDAVPGTLHHLYDPRITALDGSLYVMLAMDLDSGCRLALARSDDLARLEFLGIVSDTDTRNGVLFPEKVGGRYLRLDRPNDVRRPGEAATGSEIRLSASDDLLKWESVGPVVAGRPHYWDEWIGSGPPPIKTRAGWLHVYHGVATHFMAANIYQAGVLLLDLSDPTRVVARSRDNCLEPREPYELVGQIPNVVFPTGMVVSETDGEGFAVPEAEVRLYYGAADTCVGLATATVSEVLAMCEA